MGERNPGWWFTQLCAGIAAVTLIFAVGLGAWSLTADSVHVPSEVVKLGSYQDPVRLAWIAVGVSGTLLILLVAVTVLRSGVLAVVVVVGACVAAILVVGHLYDVITTLRMMTADIVRSPRFPAAATAWFLTAIGSVATVFGVVPISPQRRTISAPLVIAVVVSLVGSTTAVWAAVRAGDDARFVDASRAQEVEVPATPSTLGRLVFSLPLPDDADLIRPSSSVAAAGAGFVVLADGVVTAYAPDGEQRWHYRRIGPGGLRVTGANVYDEGRTLIAQLSSETSAAVVALDAMTGEQLWLSSDPRLVSAVGLRDTNLWPSNEAEEIHHLIAKDDDGWTAYDPRSGDTLWSVPPPARCDGAGTYLLTMDLPDRVAAIRACLLEGPTVVEALTIDPASGQASALTPLGTVTRPESGQLQLILKAAGSDAYWYSATGDGERITGLFDVTTGTVTTPLDAVIEGSHDPATEFLAGVSGSVLDKQRVVMNADGSARCRTDLASAQAYYDVGVGWLTEEFVIYNYADESGAPYLQAFDRRTCAPTTRVELPRGDIFGLAAAPGVLLALRTDLDGFFLDGYA